MKKILFSTFTLLLLCNCLVAQCLGGIEITDVLVDPNSDNGFNFDTDGDGNPSTNDEFVKICNTSNAAINVGNLVINDAGSGDWFTFPMPTMIMSGACVTVVSGWNGPNPLPAGVFSAGNGDTGIINNGGDVVTLISGGVECFVFDAVSGTDGCVQSATDEEVSCDPATYSFTEPTAIALSIELLNFAVTENNKMVNLDWTTSSENNNEMFVVQHSTNGRAFADLEKIEGAGTTTFKSDYSYTHNTAATGMNYYRLMQIDFDGRTSLTDIKSVEIKATNTITVSPTLAAQELTVRFGENLTSDTQINIYDIMGQLVIETTISSDNNTSVIDVANLNAGNYFLMVNMNGLLKTTKFIKL